MGHDVLWALRVVDHEVQRRWTVSEMFDSNWRWRWWSISGRLLFDSCCGTVRLACCAVFSTVKLDSDVERSLWSHMMSSFYRFSNDIVRTLMRVRMWNSKRHRSRAWGTQRDVPLRQRTVSTSTLVSLRLFDYHHRTLPKGGETGRAETKAFNLTMESYFDALKGARNMLVFKM